MGHSESKPEDASKSQANANPEILKTGLECPVCFNTLQPPTHACESGHTVCEDCFRKLPQGGNECPECRKPLVMRNIALERLLETIPHSCENKEAGCEVELLPQQLRLHQEECQWRKVPCLFPSCTQLQPLHTYGNHVQQHHAQHILDISPTGQVSFTIIPSEDKHILDISPTGQVSFTIIPSEDKHHSVSFLRRQPSHSILPYYVNLSLDLTTNQLHTCLCSWHEEASYDVTITTRDNTSLKMSCSLRTVPLSNADEAEAWKKHDNCLLMSLRSIGVRKDVAVEVSIKLRREDDELSSQVCEDEESSGKTTEVITNVKAAVDNKPIVQTPVMKVINTFEEERILAELGVFNKIAWNKLHIFWMKLLQEHARRCKYALVECLLPECEEVVFRKDLDGHILCAHAGDSIPLNREMLSTPKVWALATECTGQQKCTMKMSLLEEFSIGDYYNTPKPCVASTCRTSLADLDYQQHIMECHRDIAELNIKSATLKWSSWDENSKFTVMQVLRKFIKTCDSESPLGDGGCLIPWCSVKLKNTEFVDHILKYHKHMLIEAKGWTQGVPVTIPDPQRFPNVDKYYLLPAEGIYRQGLMLNVNYARESRSMYVWINNLDIYYTIEITSSKYKSQWTTKKSGNKIRVGIPRTHGEPRTLTVTFHKT